MEQFTFLNAFESFRRLIRDRDIILPYTQIHLSLLPTLFGEDDLLLEDQLYTLYGKNEDQQFAEFLSPLLQVLVEEERIFLLKERMDLSPIWNHATFQTFLKSGEFDSPKTYSCMKLIPMFWDDEEPIDFISLDELAKQHMHLKKAQLYFVEESDDQIQIYNWADDPTLRLKVLTGKKMNPNQDAQNFLIHLFEEEEMIKQVMKLSSVSEFYSRFDDDKIIAFDIKVHESFIHEPLFNLGLLGMEEENANREDALNFLIESIESDSTLRFKEQRGSSGGYACFRCEGATLDEIRKIHDLIEDSKNSAYLSYQTLENYSYLFDDLLVQLEELDSEDAKVIIQEIKEYEKKGTF